MGGRVLLLGAGGMLGHDLVATAPPEVTLVPLSRAQLDITQGDAVAATLGEVRPNVVINAAAYTAVDRAESERDTAMRVNGAAVGALGRNAHLVGARVIQFSSDYVFDGTATQPYSETGAANCSSVRSGCSGRTASRFPARCGSGRGRERRRAWYAISSAGRPTVWTWHGRRGSSSPRMSPA